MFKSIFCSIAILLSVFSFSIHAETREQAIQLVNQNKMDLIGLEKTNSKIVQNSYQHISLINEYQQDLDASVKIIQANIQNPNAIRAALAQMARSTQEANMQFAAIQEATQSEAKKFQTITNASKARHDVTVNAIKNIK
jgi:hypothetical protein